MLDLNLPPEPSIVRAGKHEVLLVTNADLRESANVQCWPVQEKFEAKLRQVLAGRPGIQIVGDRFVFQSEVLFGISSAELTPAGIAQMTQLAATFHQIIDKIPPDVNWVLRVDGHTDATPIHNARFASNWELSAARAIAVVKFLITQGIPATHLAATGFGEFQPVDPGNTPAAYAKNRRIEIRLTDR